MPPDQPIVEGMRVEDNHNYVDVVAGEQFNLTCSSLNGRPAPNITWINPAGEEVLASHSYAITQVC